MTEQRLCAVDGCGHPMPTGDNSPACPACWNRHRQRLAETPWLITETEHTLARQNATSGHNNTRRTEAPLPYSQAASDALTALHGVLAAWLTLAHDEHQHITRLTDPTTANISRQLLTLDILGWPHTHDAAKDYIRELRERTDRLERVIDSRPTPEYTGPCPTCETDLYVRKGSSAAACHECGTITPLDELRTRILRAANEHTWTVTEAARLLRNAGYAPLNPLDVTRWTRRGRITPAGHNAAGEPLYRLADLQAIADHAQATAR